MRGGRMVRVGAAALVVLVVLTACSDGGGSTDAPSETTPRPRTTERIAGPTPTTSPTSSTARPSTPADDQADDPSEDPALLELSGLLDDDGVLPVETALALVAAWTPIPGVDPVALEGVAPHDLTGAALRRLTGPSAGVSPEVADVLAAALEPRPDESEVEIESEGRRRELPVGDGPVTEPTTDELGGMVASVVADLEALSGHDLRLPIRARLVADRATGGDAVTSAVYAPGASSPTACRIALPRGLFGTDAATVTSTLAHEVWHCFQLDTSVDAFHGGPMWVIEGQAEWAGEAYVGGSPASAGRWDTWLLAYEQSLYRRTYDALGVYAVAAQRGSDPWATMLAMLGRGNAAAVETLFGAPADEAVLAVAQAVARAPAVGALWESDGPGITGAQGATVIPLLEGCCVEVNMTAGRFGVLPVVLGVQAADIARVELRGGTIGAVQLNGSEVVTVTPGTPVSFCLRPEGCVCPDGSHPGGGDPLPAAAPGEGAAAIGTLEGAELTVTGSLQSMEEACRRDLVGTWSIGVRQLMSILLAPYGGAGPACDGTYLLSFAADGAFAVRYDATCTFGDRTGSGSAGMDGTYTADAATVQVSGVTGSGSMTIDGVTVPLPLEGLTTSLSSPTPYAIDGDQLTLTVTAPDGNVFVIPLVRVA